MSDKYTEQANAIVGNAWRDSSLITSPTLVERIASALRTQAEESKHYYKEIAEQKFGNGFCELAEKIMNENDELRKDSGLAHHALRLTFGITEKRGEDGKYLPLSYLVTEAVKKYEAQGKLLEEAKDLLSKIVKYHDSAQEWLCGDHRFEEKAKEFLAKLEEK